MTAPKGQSSENTPKGQSSETPVRGSVSTRPIVPADVVGRFSRGVDPVDDTRRADYLTLGDWHACIRQGDSGTFDAPGYTVDIRLGMEGTPHRWSDHSATRAGCEWQAFDVIAAVGAGDCGEELAGAAYLTTHGWV